MSQDDQRLRIEICNRRPVELINFTEGLLSVGNQYKRFIAKNPTLTPTEDISLFVKEIKTGSIVADLVPMAAASLPFIIDFNNIAAFLLYLKLAYGFFIGNLTKKPDTDSQDLLQLAKIINPVACDSGAQINMYAIFNGDVKDSFNLNTVEANAAQNGINRELQLLKEPSSKLHEKVVLYWYQTRDDIRGKAGDMGIIESIKATPIKTIFDTENIKSSIMLDIDENPFHYGYIVDVVIDTINDKPAVYKIVRFHDKFKKPEENV